MKKINIIEMMKSEVCHNHRKNCELCPILLMCEDGRIEKLNKEFNERLEYCIEVED